MTKLTVRTTPMKGSLTIRFDEHGKARNMDAKGRAALDFMNSLVKPRKPSKLIVVMDETAGPMVFRDMKTFTEDAKKRGLDASSDWPLILEALRSGQSFSSKTTLFQVVTEKTIDTLEKVP